jgi:hypothetical protein
MAAMKAVPLVAETAAPLVVLRVAKMDAKLVGE